MTGTLGPIWYPLRDAAGALAVRVHNRVVNVRWGPFVGRACYVGPPVVTTPYWGEPVKKDGRAYFRELPPKRVRTYREAANGADVEPSAGYMRRQGWGREPEAWQPLPGEVWPYPLPEQLPAMPVAREGIFARIDHVKFDAAQAAAEMENEREFARRRKDNPEPVRIPWWRDGTAITYSERGAITPRECEGRVMRALYWLGRGGLVLPETHGTLLGRMSASGIGDDDFPVAELPRLARGPGETDDQLLRAMDWLVELVLAHKSGGDWFYLLASNATDRPLTYARMGALAGMSATDAHRMESRAIRHLARIANTGTPKLDDLRQSVVERNRAHARQNA